MNFLIYLSFAAFSTWKFMFTPLAGPAAGLTFWETLISCLIGGYISITLFYFASSYWMRIGQKRSTEKRRRSANGQIRKIKRYRKIVRFKHRLKRPLVCWLFPLFLSLPLGTIITAKFYRHKKSTFPLIVGGTTLNGFIITGLAYIIQPV